jgi:hypothetical protein
LIKDAKTFTNFNCQRAFELEELAQHRGCTGPQMLDPRPENFNLKTIPIPLPALTPSRNDFGHIQALPEQRRAIRSPGLRAAQRAAVELIGIEPTTSGLQSPRSPS